MPRADDDSRLVAAAVQGDRSAFALLVDRHRPRMEALARRLLGDRGDAEDVVQEAVLRAYLRLGHLREPARFGSSLYGITINLARMRRRSRARAVPLEEALLAAPSRPADELGSLRDALALLPPRQREVASQAEFDARPSDALNLAVRFSAPIYAGEDVLGQAALADGDLPARLDREAERIWGPDRPSGDWRSLSAQLAKSFYEPPRRRGSGAP